LQLPPFAQFTRAIYAEAGQRHEILLRCLRCGQPLQSSLAAIERYAPPSQSFVAYMVSTPVLMRFR